MDAKIIATSCQNFVVESRLYGNWLYFEIFYFRGWLLDHENHENFAPKNIRYFITFQWMEGNLTGNQCSERLTPKYH